MVLAVLVFFAVVLILISWLDEAVELHLYRDAAEANEHRVQPFGFWACLKHEELLQVEAMALERNRATLMSFSGSMYKSSGSMYKSIANLSQEDV